MIGRVSGERAKKSAAVAALVNPFIDGFLNMVVVRVCLLGSSNYAPRKARCEWR